MRSSFSDHTNALALEARQRALAAQSVLGRGPRYSAGEIWGESSAAERPSGNPRAYMQRGGGPAMMAAGTMDLPPGDPTRDVYGAGGSATLQGVMGSALSTMPEQFSTATALNRQGTQAILGLDRQEQLDAEALRRARITGNAQISNAWMSGIGDLASGVGSFGQSQRWWGRQG